ncbi:MAG: ATP-binding cassette domain-containing protein, partial [Candidatus Nanopelagicales bacterium]
MGVDLVIDGLCFAYGARQVLRDITVAGIPAGRVTAVIGPNAAGKPTLFKCIVGLLRASGTVTLDGAVLETLPPETRRCCLCYTRSGPGGSGAAVAGLAAARRPDRCRRGRVPE